MDTSAFAGINLVLDFLLIIGLAYYMPRHAPWLFGGLVALNLLQFFLHVPLEKLPGLREYPERQGDVVRTFEVLRVTRENFERTGTGLGGVDGNMALPAPEWRVPDIAGLFDPRSPARQALEEVIERPAAGGEGSAREGVAVPLAHDPEGVWLLVRILWLIAAAVLIFQKPTVGVTAMAFQLIPFPYLAFALPYIYFWAQDLQWVRAIEGAVRNPAEAERYISPEGMGVTLLLFVGLLLVMMCGVLVVLARRTSPDARLERNYLDPERYMVRINGNLLPFTVDGHHIEVQGIRINCRERAIYPGKPNVWQLKSSTVLEFVERG